MAASEGYKCEFIDSVFEGFYCKKCTLVARRLTLTSCCGESFCLTCIADTQEPGQPCPECGEKEFTAINQIKNQKRINALHVYCSMKERGCVWSGTLDLLDTHLDPHLDNCQYVDTKCPLNCRKTVPKNKVDLHVAQECFKRPHVCQHCGFKASYEEVVDTHLPECKYVALQCPNMCGVSCEREVMEDHMKICRLEEVECEFSSVGCDSRFIREDQDEHARQSSLKHLTLTASVVVELQLKLLEKDKKHKEEEEKLKKKINHQENKLCEQETKIGKQEKKIGEQEKKIEDLEQELNDHRKKQEEQQKRVTELTQSLHEVTAKVYHLSDYLNCIRKFEIKNFSILKTAVGFAIWKSDALYTHVCGYKFSINLNIGLKFIGIYVSNMSGPFDDQLKWPVVWKFTVEVINQQGGRNICGTETYAWKKGYTSLLPSCLLQLPHRRLGDFLVNDTLHIQITNITPL